MVSGYGFMIVIVMKKIESLLTVLCISLVFCIIAPRVYAAPTYSAGVAANQVATYNYSGTMAYNNPTTIHIRSVSGSIVNFRRDSITTDVAFDVSNVLSISPWWFVSEGMVVSDQFQSGNNNYVVNAIVSKSYAGLTWSAIQLNASVSEVIINALFDQDTGLMIYWHQHDGGSYSNTFVITSLAAESAPSIPIDASTIVVMVLAGIGVAVLLASRKINTRPNIAQIKT